jgi:RNA polymerase sigma-70 factor (ECF subfamily)
MGEPIILPRIVGAEAAVTPVAAETGAATDFAALVRQHQGMVYSLALHFLHDAEAAEEVAQDVFLELHNNLSRLSSAAHITHWLRKVASHRCIDRARRKRWQQVRLEDVPEPGVDAARPDPLLTKNLRRLVASLPETARAVVILRYQEDLTPTEIADVLSMPVATVKSQLQRSLAILRDKVARVMDVP